MGAPVESVETVLWRDALLRGIVQSGPARRIISRNRLVIWSAAGA